MLFLGVGAMKIRNYVIILAICSFAFVFRFLYEKQFGAVGYFILSITAFYLAYKNWKRSK